MRASPVQARIVSVASVFLALFAIVLVRAVQLSVLQGADLSERAAQQHHHQVALPPERGPIVDRHGDVLAVTVESASVYLRPSRFDRNATALVARTLKMPDAAMVEKLNSGEKFVWLKRDASPEQAAQLVALKLQGVGVEPSRRRVYPRGPLAGQVVGTAGMDLQGLAGIERSYDGDLLGDAKPVRVERDARGQGILRNGAVEPLTDMGARVELTIDATMQQVTETELEAAVVGNRAAAGTAVVMDPMTGEILALAHYPRFDPMDRARAAGESARNRAITDTFEPGSTFKAIVTAAALEAHVVKPDERLNCEGGSWAVGRRVIHDHERYGWLSLPDVIKHSSNICTAKVGERLGPERFFTALGDFGFRSVTSIDLPGEKANTIRPWQKWARVNLVTMSFGQGIAVTPIQLVRAYGALANGGKLMRPYVVRRVVASDGTVLRENHPQVVAQPISAQTSALITSMLRGVVEGGTGTKAKVDGIAVAGKTGTAQKVDVNSGRYSARDRISSFIGYLPADDPRYVILVVIDTPRSATYGGLVAAPAFQRIAEFGVDRLGLRVATADPAPLPEEAPHAKVQLASWHPDLVQGGMPSFLGLSMREALKQAQRAGWDVRVEGSGFVVAQDPPPGASNADGRTLMLRLGSAAG